jgi:hypothetical protein
MLIRLHNQQCKVALKFNCTPKSLASKHIRCDPQAVLNSNCVPKSLENERVRLVPQQNEAALNSICTPESLQNKRIWLDPHENMAAPPPLHLQKTAWQPESLMIAAETFASG